MSSEVTIIKNGNPFKGTDLGNEKTILSILEQVNAQAKSLAPVNKQPGLGGQLRNSIMYRTSEEAGGFNDSSGAFAERQINVFPSRGEGYLGSATKYAAYVEFGTRFMAPIPYLRPAILTVANPAKASVIAKRIMREQMRGALKEGQTRDKFKSVK